MAPRPGAGPGASYTLSGGQTFQKELTGGVYELVRPKAETVGTVYADLDGDGSDETVRLCVEETVEPDGSGVPLVTSEAALRPYRLGDRGGWPYRGLSPWRRGRAVRGGGAPVRHRADRAGAPVVVAGLREEGASGVLAVYALLGSPKPAPSSGWKRLEYSIQGLLEGTTAHVVVPETGNAEDLDLNWWLSRQNAQADPEYGRNGPTARSTGAGRRNLRRGTGGARGSRWSSPCGTGSRPKGWAGW